mgnify:FL=1
MNATATKLTKGTKYDLDSLTCVDWTGDDTGLDCWAYFRDGVYLGPDADGVEPLFAAADPIKKSARKNLPDFLSPPIAIDSDSR